MGVIDFVSDAPEEDGRAVPVAANPRSDIRFPMVFKKACVVIFGLMKFPHIERLGIHENAELVAKIHEFNRGRIVGGTNGVTAHRKKGKQLPFGRCLVNGGA